uniref:Solute carrier family 22 member 7 n=1 Tax=Phasianus colchicus TaxID=9054 RepID=A0A669P0B9_PHACC
MNIYKWQVSVKLSRRKRPGMLPHFALLTKTRRPSPGEALCDPAERCLPLTAMEWVDTEHRTFSGVLTSISWSVGNMLLALTAYLVREWHWLLVAVTGPCLLSIVCLWWVPESARWLIANGKVKQAHKHLLRCARMNGRKDFTDTSSAEDLSVFWHSVVSSVTLHNGFILHCPADFPLFQSPYVPCRFGVAFSYYGMSMNLTGFGLNMYLSQFVFGIIEIPAKILMYVLVNRIGRRHSQAWSLILTGLCIGIFSASDVKSLDPPKNRRGKRDSIFYFFIFFSYLFRQNGMGYTSFMARLGGSLAPLVFLLDDVWRSLPEVTYCGVAVFCGSVAFLLPETLNVRLPEGIEDIEKTHAPEGLPLQSLPK